MVNISQLCATIMIVVWYAIRILKMRKLTIAVILSMLGLQAKLGAAHVIISSQGEGASDLGYGVMEIVPNFVQEHPLLAIVIILLIALLLCFRVRKFLKKKE